MLNKQIALQLNGIWHQYRGQSPLHFANWQIAQGEQWLMLGKSGSGKTTLMHIMAGLLKPHNGEVILHQQSLYQLPPGQLDRLRGQHVGIVFQQPHLLKSLTVAENMLLAQYVGGKAQSKSLVNQVLSSLHIYQERHKKPHQLSQGQLQRAAIARAIINQPTILIADEPTSSLDDGNAYSVLELLLEQSSTTNMTLIIATHDQRVKSRLSLQYILS
ncbi:ATP-binding cassette domain-containing protein [Mucilaginibacter robiniae]|uniref:ATP-binding cassette domain-containing protein n=1 Tax=Mucilaginibacter robiniae TaxID=2728022 RepID=A0A7L5DWI4_9SPHI|nr:ATP-binding cassette domain-containing protein [Mucilaginibacter robiniae]QJD95460.1 ATP-binding cassette domain-containing protein [Mucilaginibacter robiniae]